MCVTQETKGAVSLSLEPWSIDYADDTEAQPISEWWDGEFAQPLYPADRKAVTGQCVRGWVIFKPLKGQARPSDLLTLTGRPGVMAHPITVCRTGRRRPAAH